jgi:hypothetical protein
MPSSPPRREARLRLALLLADFYATRPIKPDPITRTTEQVLPLLRRLFDLQQRYQLCYGRNWPTAARTLANRQAGQLRELSYVLGGLDRSPPSIRPVVTVANLYRDLEALEGGVRRAGDQFRPPDAVRGHRPDRAGRRRPRPVPH